MSPSYSDAEPAGREEIYREVWSQPMSRVAPTFGMSERELANVCDALKIPVPPRGYWRQKRQGYTIELPPLEPLDNPRFEGITFKRVENPEYPNQLPADAGLLVKREKLPEYRIVVPDEADAPHPLVVRTRAAIEKARPDQDGCVSPKRKGCLSVWVTPSLVDRSLRILDAVLKAFEARGFPVSPAATANTVATVEILGESVPFGLDEKVYCEPRESEGSKKPSYDYRPTGRLTLWTVGRERRQYRRDNDKRRLENALNSFVVALIEAAARKREGRLKAEKASREREEQKRHEAAEKRRKEEDQVRAKWFTASISAWREARDMRDFIAAVRTEALRRHGGIEEGSDIALWLGWAERRVAELGPLHEPKVLPAYVVEVPPATLAVRPPKSRSPHFNRPHQHVEGSLAPLDAANPLIVGWDSPKIAERERAMVRRVTAGGGSVEVIVCDGSHRLEEHLPAGWGLVRVEVAAWRRAVR